MELSYQDYITQNYVKLINSGDVHIDSYMQHDINNKNMLKITFNINYNSYIIKKNCIMFIYWYGAGRGMQRPDDLSNYNQLGFKEYNIKKNCLNIKIPECPYTFILYNELKKGDLIDRLFKLETNKTYYGLLFDNITFTSEIDYNRKQKQKEQHLIYEKEQITNKSIIKLEEEFNHKYVWITSLIKTNERDITEDKEKIKKLEQENAELRERLKKIEEKLFMSVEHKYF